MNKVTHQDDLIKIRTSLHDALSYLSTAVVHHVNEAYEKKESVLVGYGPHCVRIPMAVKYYRVRSLYGLSKCCLGQHKDKVSLLALIKMHIS